MRTLISLVYWTLVALSTVPLFAGALLIAAASFPFDHNRKFLHLYSCAWAQLYFRSNPFWRLHIEGRDRLPWRGPAVLVANHQSLGDILVLFGLFRPFKWVSKQSVFQIPFIGWNMWLNGYVGLVRGDRESVARMFQACEWWLDRGVPVLLFPEGTRSPDGEVKAFKDGAFQLAVKKGCPLVPIALAGTARTLPKHGFVLRGRANCRVQVLEAIDPARFAGDVPALRDRVRALIIDEVRRLESTAPSSRA